MTRRHAHREGLRRTILRFVPERGVLVIDGRKDAQLDSFHQHRCGFLSNSVREAKSMATAQGRQTLADWDSNIDSQMNAILQGDVES